MNRSKVMATPEFENKRNALLKKIDPALSLLCDYKVDDPTDNPTGSEIISFEAMREAYKKTGYVLTPREIISPDFSSFCSYKLYRSRILTDKKLYEAILHARIVENESEFEMRRSEYKGQLVWVSVEHRENRYRYVELQLISHNRIIYSLDKCFLENIRRNAGEIWAHLRVKVEHNLVEALLSPNPTEESSECVSDLQSSSDIAVATNSADKYQVRYSITDEVKKVMLDELNSLNLDPRIKQQFVFDLKVLPDKDVFYWRDRLDSLRLCSSYAAANSQESAELQKLSQLVADLEKITRDSATWLASADRIPKTMVPKTVSQVQNVVNQPQIGTSPDTVSSLTEAAGDQVACLKTKAEEAKVSGENMQKLTESISSLAKSVSTIAKQVDLIANPLLAKRNEDVIGDEDIEISSMRIINDGFDLSDDPNWDTLSQSDAVK